MTVPMLSYVRDEGDDFGGLAGIPEITKVLVLPQRTVAVLRFQHLYLWSLRCNHALSPPSGIHGKFLVQFELMGAFLHLSN